MLTLSAPSVITINRTLTCSLSVLWPRLFGGSLLLALAQSKQCNSIIAAGLGVGSKYGFLMEKMLIHLEWLLYVGQFGNLETKCVLKIKLYKAQFDIMCFACALMKF